MLKPPDLIGHISLHLNVGSAADTKDVIPIKPVMPFQRMRDPKTREVHEVSMLLPSQKIVRHLNAKCLKIYQAFH
jgi:pre-rRNA-processing protein IPI3